MAAKKKRTSDRQTMLDELDRLRKLLSTTEDDLMHMEKRLTEANELFAKGKETTRSVVLELTQTLAKKDKQIEGADRERAGVNAMIDFLWEEIDRYRNRLMDHIRWDGMLPKDLHEAMQKVRMEAYAWEHDDEEKTR
jgi:alpha-D-ribose 1-methylphosphonate 5-triphosphate synthase subunit PhnG